METNVLDINWLEIIAAILGAVHVFYLTKQKIWCWPIGIIAVILSAMVFYQEMLYSDMILYSLYVLFNMYGWITWAKGSDDSERIRVTWLNRYSLLMTVSIIAVGTFIWGYLMQRNTNAQLVYIDAFTTVASLTAQFLLTRKKIDNWIIWLIVNTVSFGMYTYKGLYFFAALSVVYFVLSAIGLKEWKRDYSKIISS